MTVLLRWCWNRCHSQSFHTCSCMVTLISPMKTTLLIISDIQALINWNDQASLLNHPINSPNHAFTHIHMHTNLNKIALWLTHQSDGDLRWLSDRSWSEASLACHNDLSTVKHGTECSLSVLWRHRTELLHVQLTQWYLRTDIVEKKDLLGKIQKAKFKNKYPQAGQYKV